MFGALDAVELHPRRRWTAAVSFTLQAAAVGAALTIPLLYPNNLPEAFAHRRIFVPASGSEIQTNRTTQSTAQGHLPISTSVRPIFVPRDNGVHFPGMKPYGDTTNVAPDLPTGPGGPGIYTGPNIGEVIMPTVHPTLAPPPPRISRMMEGNLIHRVDPVYPQIAKTAGIQGVVIIKAIISPEGRIEQEQLISGSPLLARAALDAVRLWRYRPYLLNDQPVEVETEITVNFVLQR